MTSTPPPAAEVEDDPEHRLDDAVPLDRQVHVQLADAVLNPPTDRSTLRPVDCQQIALELAGHARVVADDVRRRCALLAPRDPKRVLTETVLAEADGRLNVPPRPTISSAQNRARLLKTLYERLDTLPPVPDASPPP